MKQAHHWQPPWPGGPHAVYDSITFVVVLSVLIYLMLTIDIAVQAWRRNGLPFKRHNITPVALGEWAIVFWLSGGFWFAVYRSWLRFFEGGGSSDARLLYVDIYRLAGGISVYLTTCWIRRWVGRTMALKAKKEEPVYGV